jgi:hypothetical protein
MQAKQRSYLWLWLIPAFVLLMWLGARQLDADGLWYDEVWSVSNAAGAQYGPLSPAGIWERVTTEDPDQGIAYPWILAGWGALVGWTEFATRALSLLVGVLTAALVYRLGHDTLAPAAGLAAAVMLCVSAFFVYYTHELRVFTIVAFSSALILWCYWRIMTTRQIPNIGVQIGFVMGGLGLLYTHYVAATLLIALGIYHVLFAAKTRRWWRVTGLALIVGLLYSPWLPVLITSITRTSTRDDVHAKAFAPDALLTTLLHYAGNGVGLAALVLIGMGVAWWIYNLTSPHPLTPSPNSGRGSAGMVMGIALLAIPVVVAMNVVLKIIEPGRVRYLIVLWIPVTLLMGMGVAAAGHILKRKGTYALPVIAAILLLWVANGLRANLDEAFSAPLVNTPMPRWHVMTDVIRREATPTDIFAFYAGEKHSELLFSFEHMTKPLPITAFITRALVEDEYRAWAEDKLTHAPRIWYGIEKREISTPEYEAMTIFLQDRAVWCETRYEDAHLRFDVYAQSSAFCPHNDVIARFGDGIMLTGADITPEKISDTMTVYLGWQVAPDVPPETYSVALQVLDATGTMVAGQDVGLPAGSYPALRVDIALDGLPAGSYTLNAIVYDWRTLARLPAANAAGSAGDMVALKEFTVEED